MSDADLREDWLRFREESVRRRGASKQSNFVLIDLSERYNSLSTEEQGVIDGLLADQLDSQNENVRFDALAVIGEFRVVSALPALRLLAERLEAADSPGAPYEWAKVNRLVGELS